MLRKPAAVSSNSSRNCQQDFSQWWHKTFLNSNERVNVCFKKQYENHWEINCEMCLTKKKLKRLLTAIKPDSKMGKWAKDLNRHFSKEAIWMSNKHVKKCSISLIIREMQIKTAIRMASMAGAETEKSKYWQECEEIETCVHFGWTVKYIIVVGNSIEVPQEIKNSTIIQFSNSASGSIPKIIEIS